jgi:hypothetical protein
MATTLEYGKKILITRMIKSLEKEGYKVEFAPDYEGFIIADRRDDPNIFLLATSAIEEMRSDNAGKPAAFIEAIIRFVKNNISLGTASVPPTKEVMRDIRMPADAQKSPPPLRGAPQQRASTPSSPMPDTEDLDKHALDILEAPTDDDVADVDDVEEISNIIPEDNLKKRR